MATWPCPTILDCECSDNPLRNLTSENPDPLTFFARVFPPFPVTINGPVDTFWAPGCVSDCFSTVSQFDAEACALRQATVCNNTPPTGNPAGPELFGNEPQSCEALCPMGDPFVYSIPAGTFLAVNQELANLIAQSFCLEQAIESRMCEGMPPGPPGTVCPTITGVSPASPINANVGDNITLTATYSFPGSTSALTFVWFLNGSPIAILHDDPTLQINDIMESEEGDYTLGIFANGCDPVFSDPITINVGCVAEMPPPAAPAINNSPGPLNGTYDYTTLVAVGQFEQPNASDVSFGTLPAGNYDLTYVGGAFHSTQNPCPDTVPPFIWKGDMGDLFYNNDTASIPNPINMAYCELSQTDYENQVLAAPTVSFTHTGGTAKLAGIPTYAGGTPGTRFPTFDLTYHQLDPMPVNLQIVHFDDFVNLLQVCSTCQDRVGIEWDGSLERVTYGEFDIRYNIGAPFSSATISLNGKRISTSSVAIFLDESPPGTPVWKLLITCKATGEPNANPSGHIVWSGIKAAGRTPVGVYASLEEACNPGKNPGCCRIEEI